LVSVKVTRVPPDVGPVAGATDVTVGGIGGGTGDPVSTVLKSEQTIPSSGVVKVARTPTTPLGGIDFVIVALVGGSVTATGPLNRETISLCDVLQRLAVTPTLVPISTSTVRVPPA
jgi:hypothetical protein